MTERRAAEAPVGVFDSGVGGLTVHHKLVERFPTEGVENGQGLALKYQELVGK